MRARWLVCLAAVALLSAEARAGGVIHGTIWSSRGEARRATLARERVAAQVPPRRGFFGLFSSPPRPGLDAAAASASGVSAMPVPRRQPGITDAVVSIREIPAGFEKRLAQQSARDRSRPYPRIVLSQSRFRPRVLATAVGSNVEFQNLDRIWHSTFSVSSAHRFDLGKLQPGAMDTVRFDAAGVINVHCDIHPDETGFVVVTPNHAIARPDSLGRFTLPRLPPGTYKVDLWHPQRGARESMIVVPKRGEVACDMAF